MFSFSHDVMRQLKLDLVIVPQGNRSRSNIHFEKAAMTIAVVAQRHRLLSNLLGSCISDDLVGSTRSFPYLSGEFFGLIIVPHIQAQTREKQRKSHVSAR